MKGKSVPTPVVVALAVLVVLILGFMIYQNFVSQPPQIDPAKDITPERLEDPDPRSDRALGK